MIGVTSLSISNIRFQYYNVSEFLEYCDTKKTIGTATDSKGYG